MARYVLTFRKSDTSLSPVFTLFKRLSDLATITPTPGISSIGEGMYFFDYSPDTDIVFSVDGGATVPDSDRYIREVIGPRDVYLDGPVTGVKDDILGDEDVWPIGSKGAILSSIGASDGSTIFEKLEEVSEDVQGVVGNIGTLEALLSDVPSMIRRLLGLHHENSVMDQVILNSFGKMTSARVRLFNSKSEAQAPESSTPLAQYSIQATYTGADLKSYTSTREG